MGQNTDFLQGFYVEIFNNCSLGLAQRRRSSRFPTTTPTDARTAHLDFVELRAALCRHGCHFFASSQRNGERKDARAFPPGPPSVRRLHSRRRVVAFCKLPPSWAHKRTPKMGLLLARVFAVSCCLKFGGNGLRKAKENVFAKAACVTLKCLQVF